MPETTTAFKTITPAAKPVYTTGMDRAELVASVSKYAYFLTLTNFGHLLAPKEYAAPVVDATIPPLSAKAAEVAKFVRDKGLGGADRNRLAEFASLLLGEDIRAEVTPEAEAKSKILANTEAGCFLVPVSSESGHNYNLHRPIAYVRKAQETKDMKREGQWASIGSGWMRPDGTFGGAIDRAFKAHRLPTMEEITSFVDHGNNVKTLFEAMVGFDI